MGEIKISVSDKLEKLIESICDELGIKKTEFVKSLVINHLRDFVKEAKKR
jgi:hypothetical protein